MNTPRKMKLLFTVLTTTLLFVTWPGMNETSRYLLSKNIVTSGTFYIREYYQTTDRSFYNNRYFSDKEPGVSFLITPIVWTGLSLEKIVGIPAKQFITHRVGGVEIKTPVNISIFETIAQIFSVLLISGVPTALTTILIYKFLLRLTKKDDLSLAISLVYFLSSLAFHYSLLLQPYAISTFLIFLAFYLSFFYKKNRWSGFLIGMICGISVLTDLSSSPIAFLVILYFFYSKGKLDVSTLLAGTLAVLPFLLYNFVNFENPLTPPRLYLDKSLWARIPGNHGIILDPKFNFISLIRMLIDPYRGLFVYYPIVFLCFLGWYKNYKKYKVETLLVFLIFLFSLLVGSSWWAWWHGATFGPKFLLISQPFLFLGLSKVLKNYKGFFLALFLLSVFTNLIGLTANYEDMLKDVNNSSLMKKEYEKIFYSPKFLPDVLRDYYLPQFLKWGPRSRVIETILNGQLDIRAMKKLSPPKYPFLPLLIFLSILSFLWRKEMKNVLTTLSKALSKSSLKFPRIKPKSYEFLIIIILLFVLLNFSLASFDILFYPFDVDYSESFHLINTLKFLEGKNIYEINKENLVVSKYPPLFYILSSPFIEAFGGNLFSLRLLSILCLFFSSVVIYRIVETLTKRKILALVSSLSFFTSFITFHCIQVKPDNVALLFFLLSIYFFFKKKYKSSLIFSTFSILIKQTYFPPLIVFILYFYKQELLKKYISIPLLILGCFLISSILAYSFTFLRNLLFFTRGIPQFDLKAFQNFFLNFLPALSILSIYLFKTKNFVIRWLISLTFLVTLLQFFRLGGWVYYFLPLQALFSISLGILLGKEKGIGIWGLVSLFMLSIFVSFIYDSRIFLYIFQRHKYPPLKNINSDLSLLRELKEAKKPYIEHASYGIYLNKTMPEIWSYVELYRNRAISCKELIEKFKKYDKIMFYSRIKDIPCLYEFISRNYALARSIKWEDLAFHEREWYIYIRKTS